MTLITCFNCNEAITNSANFCSSCGTNLKCSQCNTQLVSKSNFCQACGHALKNISTTSTNPLNTLKFRKTENETYYDIAFSDAIGKEGINELLLAVFQNRSANSNIPRNLSSDVDVTYLPKANESDIHADSVTKPSEPEVSESVQLDLPHLHDLESKLVVARLRG